MLKMSTLAGMVLAAAVLSGCGGSTEVVQPTVNATVGQQLIDLKKARDSGALTEQEYQKQRTQLIDSIR
jgi:hypothetical protein